MFPNCLFSSTYSLLARESYSKTCLLLDFPQLLLCLMPFLSWLQGLSIFPPTSVFIFFTTQLTQPLMGHTFCLSDSTSDMKLISFQSQSGGLYLIHFNASSTALAWPCIQHYFLSLFIQQSASLPVSSTYIAAIHSLHLLLALQLLFPATNSQLHLLTFLICMG